MFAGKSKLLFSGLSLIGIFLLAGCGARPTASLTPTPTETPTASVTPTASLTNTPTVTPTETATLEPTPTSPPYTRCQEIIDAQLPKDFLTEGSIIFDGECEGQQGLYKLKSGTNQIVPFLANQLDDDSNSFYSVSPDSRWLMISGRDIVVTGADDSTIVRYPLNRQWLSAPEWQKDELIKIRVWSGATATYDLLNPFTGSFFRFYYPYSSLDRGEIYFDPPFARVIYFDDWESKAYILKEIATDRQLWQSERDPMREIYASQPRWSPNGLYFVIPIWDGKDKSQFRLMAVTREGKTFTSNQFFQLAENLSRVPFDWSPSGKYVVLITKTANGDQQISLWSPETNQTSDSGFSSPYSIYWPTFAPDERSLVVNVVDNSGGIEKITSYFVEIPTKRSIRLDLRLNPVAWLKTGSSIKTMQNEPFPISPQGGALVKQACVQSSDTANIDGTLVFFQQGYLSLLGADRRIQKLVETEFRPTTTAAISPDRKKILYWLTDSNFDWHYWLYSFGKSPTEVLTKDIASRYDSVLGWFNDQEVWIQTPSESWPLLFDPFNNKIRKLPEFAEPQIAGCVDWDYCNGLSGSMLDFYFYDQALERNIFLATGETSATIVMLDREANYLWKYANRLVGFNMPKWSPNNHEFGVPLPKDELGEHYEFFVVDHDGHQRQITDYSAAYPTMTIDKFSWSPDGRYIAFWGDTHSQEKIAQQHPYRLFVLDTVTRQTVDYCVAGKYSSHFAPNHAPIWSPDGNQIAVESIQSGKQIIMLVDFASGTVSPVAEGELVGWIAEP